MISIRFASVLAVVCAASLGGCATYVNIPPQPGDLARNNPNIDTVRQVESATIKAVLGDRRYAEPVHVVLPEGTTAESLAAVVAPFGDRVSKVKIEGQPTIEIKQVRVRGRAGEVDVIVPSNLGDARQLVTVYVVWEPLPGWQHSRLRYWRIPVEEALQKSRAEWPTTSEEQ